MKAATSFRFLMGMLSLALGGFLPATSVADVAVRVSFKIILDSGGARPVGGLSTDDQILSLLTNANRILEATGRGYHFQLAEPIVEVRGKSAYFAPDNPPGDPSANPPIVVDPRETHLNLLDAASAADPAGFARRGNAVNCYINAKSYTAICSFPHDSTQILLCGQDAFGTSLAHELGHYFNLLHTHAGDSGVKGQMPPQTLKPGNSDQCADTEPDHNDWDRNDIARTLGYATDDLLQASDNTALKLRAERIWRNLMSYHDPNGRSYLSPDQMDRWAEAANSSRRDQVTGKTLFVAATGQDSNDGLSSASPLQTLATGIARVTGNDDVILLRAGSYDLSRRLDRPCTLRAGRGVVTITNP